MEGGTSIQDTESEITNSDGIVENDAGCSYTCCNPRGKMHRFVALLFMCFLGFGEYL